MQFTNVHVHSNCWLRLYSNTPYALIRRHLTEATTGTNTCYCHAASDVCELGVKVVTAGDNQAHQFSQMLHNQGYKRIPVVDGQLRELVCPGVSLERACLQASTAQASG